VPDPPVEVVLVRPEIPNNTGTIGRTVAAVGGRLHVVRPIGFEMDEKARRRAGLDYWRHLDWREHASWEAYLADARPRRAWLFTARAERSFWEADFRRGDVLVFGRESDGAPPKVHEWIEREHGADHRLALPMLPKPELRSLNLACAVTAAVYEALRRIGWTPPRDA